MADLLTVTAITFGQIGFVRAYLFGCQSALDNAMPPPVWCGRGGRPYPGNFLALENEGSGAPQGAWPGFEPDRPG